MQTIERGSLDSRRFGRYVILCGWATTVVVVLSSAPRLGWVFFRIDVGASTILGRLELRCFFFQIPHCLRWYLNALLLHHGSEGMFSSASLRKTYEALKLYSSSKISIVSVKFLPSALYSFSNGFRIEAQSIRPSL